MKRLSQIKYPDRIAFCPKCEEFFIDDLPAMDKLRCPNPGCDRALQTGYTLEGRVVLDPMGRKFKTLEVMSERT